MNAYQLLIFSLLLVIIPIPGICEEIRVVSLAPVATEMIYALGAQDSLVGVTDVCKIEHSKAIKRLGAYSAVSLELVYSLRPTLVLVTEGAENQAEMLKALGLKVVEIKTTSLQQVKTSFLELAKLIHQEKKGDDFIKEGEGKLEQIRAKSSLGQVKTNNVLILFGDEGSHFGANSFYGIGLSTFYNDLLEFLGFTNVMKQAGYNILSLEGVCSLRPTCIILVSDSTEEAGKSSIRSCNKEATIKVFPKIPFLYPGIKYPEIAESIARCWES